MKIKDIIGLNVISTLFQEAFQELECAWMDCIAFNVNLDYVLHLFNEYSCLERVNIWSNTENIVYSYENKESIRDLITTKKLSFYRISENINILHSKMYRFKKNDDSVLISIGSPNLSFKSNQNFESLINVYDSEFCDKVWSNIEKIQSTLNINFDGEAPIQIFEDEEIIGVSIEEELLQGLWKHQSQILKWAVNKQYSIVNIPPGTGKTEITMRYIKHLFDNYDNLTSIVLVPTTTLLYQWINRVEKAGLKGYEWGTTLSGLDSYFANPEKKVLVTLYSRFVSQYEQFQKRARILEPNILLIYDECHNTYNNLEQYEHFRRMINAYGSKTWEIGLSATLDTFNIGNMMRYIDYMGGNNNRYELSLQSFYSHWNELNERPVLKYIKYLPIFYQLSTSEMGTFNDYNQKIAIQMSKPNIMDSFNATAAIQRARWLRGLPGAQQALNDYFSIHLVELTKKSTIIFVQTHEIAERLHTFITDQPTWDPESSIYIYDSYQHEKYLEYALEKFRQNVGFFLISERMLAEGFDLPKVDVVILHGSHRSPRDWIQKIGRAIRYNPEEPEATANIVDIVFCDPFGEPLDLEKERFEVLKSISR